MKVTRQDIVSVAWSKYCGNNISLGQSLEELKLHWSRCNSICPRKSRFTGFKSMFRTHYTVYTMTVPQTTHQATLYYAIPRQYRAIQYNTKAYQHQRNNKPYQSMFLKAAHNTALALPRGRHCTMEK